MARILSVDYGKKRTGIAVTDPLQIICNGLVTVSSSTLVDFLLDYTKREEVELIVVGEPKQTNGQPSENLERVRQFVARWKKACPTIPVVYYDERFTSVLAHRAMLDGGLKKKPDKTRRWSTRLAQQSFCKLFRIKKKMILPVYTYGQQVLRKVAQDIPLDYTQLERTNPKACSKQWKPATAFGLAAPQIGLDIRLLVVDLDVLAETYPEYKGYRKAFINPHHR